MPDLRALSVLLLSLTVPAWAATSAEDDALMLADAAPETVVQTKSDWRVFTEASLGQVNLRQSTGRTTSADTQRFSLDVLYDKKLSPELRAVFSDRLDVSHQSGATSDQSDTINTLKEAYLSWQPSDSQVFTAGRVNARYGVAQGYNPTDFFRERANRSLVSVDPNSIRENRLGTAMLRAQTLWAGASLSTIIAPKLADTPNNASWSPDLGSTNNRTRWLVAASQQLGNGLNPQFLVFGDDRQNAQLGLNLSTVLSDATVGHVEWSGGRMKSLAAQALPLSTAVAQDESFRNRLAAGFTYTSASKVALTAEYHYNGAAPDQAQWNALRNGSQVDYGLYRLMVRDRMELTTRQAAFLRLGWSDAFVNKLDLAAMMRVNLEDHSRLSWLEARYRWDRTELALQWQLNSGELTSDYGAVVQQRNVQAQARYYFE
jgi:hypothetical protein